MQIAQKRLQGLVRRRSFSFLSLFFLLFSLSSFGLREGDKIPNFLLPTAKGTKIDLAKYAASKGKRNLLLIFFRTGTCGVCLSQLQEYARYAPEVELLNTAVLSVSLDDAIVQSRTNDAIEGKFPIMLDPEAKLTKAFDVFNPDEKLARPSIFLIGPDRLIKYSYVGQAIQDRPQITVVLDMVKHYSGLAPTKSSRGVTSTSKN